MFRQICLTIFLLSGFASVGLAGQGHSMDQIDTCFHWLETNQLLAKIEYARKYDGAFYFHQRQPVYCWKSPLGAYSAWERHGNELLRIKLKPGIRVVERYRGKSIDDMIDTPVIYSKEREWHEYIITPEAIESWSIYHPNMVNEMKAELAYYGTFTKKPNPNDVFYPIEQYDFSFLTSVIPNIIEKHSQAAQEGRSEIFGKNQEDHFKTKFRLPWQNMFQVNRNDSSSVKRGPRTVEIIKASYGGNLNLNKQVSDVTELAREFCRDKEVCNYKVHPRFIGDPAPHQDKDFEINWKCSGALREGPPVKIKAPADYTTIRMSCQPPLEQ